MTQSSNPPKTLKAFLNSTIKLALMASLLIVLTNCASPLGTKTQSTSQRQTHTSTNALSKRDTEHYQQSKQWLEDGEFKSAEQQLRMLSKHHPEHPGVWANLAIAHFYQNEIDAAHKAAHYAAQLQGESAHIDNLLGLIAMKRGRFDRAKHHYLSAIKKHASFANAHYNLALLYDIYYQEIAKAYDHYATYLKLTDNNDIATKDWLEQLKFSLESDNNE